MSSNWPEPQQTTAGLVTSTKYSDFLLLVEAPLLYSSFVIGIHAVLFLTIPTASLQWSM